MAKLIERWLVYKFAGGQFIPLSKSLKTKKQAEQVRLKFPERERRIIGVGVIRIRK